ncbi:MAG: sodium:solute symporter family protein [Planctomycetes bacterium]|nr:sodium:solute symporter family protein [Planctomycetota bacterium]MCB9871759.1 sodium:solute symporter family protein [Planctomycetota bacterium]
MRAMLASPSFGALDTAIVVVYLAISVAAGLLANRVVTGLTGYLVAGRSLGTALSVATMTGSELGLITVMYNAQLGYREGFKALHIGLVAGLVTLVVGVTGFVVVRLRQTGVMTIPEYYELRFGRRTRILGGVLLALGGILNMGLFLQVGGQFVVAVTGMSPDMLRWVMTGLLALVLVYTVLGGMVSVVLTDYVQFVVLSAGLVAMVLIVLSRPGLGMEQIVATWQQRPDEAFDPIRGHGLGYISWQAVLGFVSCAVWPTAVSRALSARDASVVRWQLGLSSLSFLVRVLVPGFMGVAAFVFLTQAGAVVGSDGGFQLEGVAYKSIQAYPVLLREVLPIGVLGLITAAMLAAFMSTHDSYLLCWASVIARDVIAPLHPNPTDRRQLLWTRVGIVAIGAWVWVWGTCFEPKQAVWDYLAITGAVFFTGAIAVLIPGLYWRRASSTGAVAALIAGLSALLGLHDVRAPLGLAEWESWQVGLSTLGLSVAAMVVGSLLFPDRARPVVEVAR